MDLDRWHTLLSSRYVCESCTTRFYSRYHICPACHKLDSIHPLHEFLREWAQSDAEYRTLITAGQDPARLPAAPAAMLEYVRPRRGGDS